MQCGFFDCVGFDGVDVGVMGEMENGFIFVEAAGVFSYLVSFTSTVVSRVGRQCFSQWVLYFLFYCTSFGRICLCSMCTLSKKTYISEETNSLQIISHQQSNTNNNEIIKSNGIQVGI